MLNKRESLHNSLKAFFKVDNFMDFVEELHENDPSKGNRYTLADNRIW